MFRLEWSVPMSQEERERWAALKKLACPVCERPLGERKMQTHPDGVTTHRACARSYEAQRWPMKFALGQLVATPGAIEALESNRRGAREFIVRHAGGDFGELDDFDKRANQEAIELGLRILSAYDLPDGTRIWVITEADRSATTILLPSEY